MDLILEEMHKLVTQGVEKITLPKRRLPEFLMAATEHRFFTLEELEQFRAACLRGEAKAWGVPVEFTPTPL